MEYTKIPANKLKENIKWVEKEKVSDWLGLPYMGERQTNAPKLYDVANVLKTFENPPIVEQENAEEGSRFSIINRNQVGFVSNAIKVVEGIKQEKATPSQWLAMIQNKVD